MKNFRKQNIPRNLLCVNWKNKFVKNLNMYYNRNSKFGLCHTSFRDLWWFFGGFWRAKILKSEQDFNLTNNIVGSFDMYSKGHNRIQTMPHPFNGPVIIFG